MSTHLLPALFSCISPHTTWETENTMEFCGYVAPILDQKGVRTRGVSYLNYRNSEIGSQDLRQDFNYGVMRTSSPAATT